MHELHLVRVFRKRIEGLKNKAALRVQQDGQWRDISWQAVGRSMDYLAQALIRLARWSPAIRAVRPGADRRTMPGHSG